VENSGFAVTPNNFDWPQITYFRTKLLADTVRVAFSDLMQRSNARTPQNPSFRARPLLDFSRCKAIVLRSVI
jgi:hypothetical protein